MLAGGERARPGREHGDAANRSRCRYAFRARVRGRAAASTRSPALELDEEARRVRRDSWIGTALQRAVVLRSLRVAGAVGTLLVAINHGDRLLTGSLLPLDWVKMALTYLVPYGVATYAAVQALRRRP